MNVVVSHWSANVAVLAAYAVTVAVHLLGMPGAVAAARRGGHASPRDLAREAVAFHFGLLTVVLATVSPVGYWAGVYVWVRCLQDLMLAFVAPALIVLGAPWLVLARGLRLRRRQPAAGPAAGRPEPGSAVAAARAQAPAWAGARRRGGRGWLSLPVGVTVLFNLIWWGWHLPAAFDGVLNGPLIYGAEVITYLVGGVLLWLQLIGSRPFSPSFAPLQRVMLIAGTVVSDTVLGMMLGFGSSLLYPRYLAGDHGVVAGVVSDQQVGGAEVWVLALPPLIIAGIALLIRWLNEEESEALASGLDRLLTPPKSAWPSRPGLR